MTTDILSLAGRGSVMQRNHRVCIDYVTVANFPDNYESRMVRAFPIFPKLRLWVLEAHDLALTKLDRSNERDIGDVMFLAQNGWIGRETLIQRFETEMEPYLTGRTPTWNRTTLRIWIDSCWPPE